MLSDISGGGFWWVASSRVVLEVSICVLWLGLWCVSSQYSVIYLVRV